MKESNMLKHIVQIHPIEAGQLNVEEVSSKHVFNRKEYAMNWIDEFNREHAATERYPEEFRAVYCGCMDTETGDFVL